jgi:hypothetical protein
LDSPNTYNYVFSSYFKDFNFSDKFLCLFSLFPFSFLQENVNDAKYACLAKSNGPVILDTALLKIVIAICCFIRHIIYDNNNNNNNNININKVGISNIENKYYNIFNFLHKISENSLSYYSNEENNYYSRQLKVFKDEIGFWKEMSNEYERKEKMKTINKLI